MKILKIIGVGIGIILVILLIVSMPFILDGLLYSTHIYDSHLSSAEWSSFNGSYIGAIMGGIVTLIGIWITIKFQQTQAKKDRQFQSSESGRNRQFQLDEAKNDREFQRDQANEDRRLAITPFLKYKTYNQDTKSSDKETITKEKGDFDIYMNCEFDNQPNQSYAGIIKLKNIGMGPAIDVRIYETYLNTGKAQVDYQSENDILEKDGSLYVLINLDLKLVEITEESVFSNSTGILKFKVGYKDLLQYKYEQEIEIEIALGYLAHKNLNEWTINRADLDIIKRGKPKLMQSVLD